MSIRMTDKTGAINKIVPANKKQEWINKGYVELKEDKELEAYTVPELKKMCKEKGLKGYSKLNESELIALLEGE